MHDLFLIIKNKYVLRLERRQCEIQYESDYQAVSQEIVSSISFFPYQFLLQNRQIHKIPKFNSSLVLIHLFCGYLFQKYIIFSYISYIPNHLRYFTLDCASSSEFHIAQKKNCYHFETRFGLNLTTGPLTLLHLFGRGLQGGATGLKLPIFSIDQIF